MITRLFLTLCLTATVASAAPPKNPPTLTMGAQAPDFSLPGTDGKTYSLASFSKAKALVLVFTCNHCPDAVAARGRIQELATYCKGQGAQLVAISGNDPLALQLWELGWSVYGDSFPEMKALATETKMTFPYLYDGETQAATVAYGAKATPHVFIFDAQRKLRYQGNLDNGRRGKPTKHNARVALDEILAGKAVSTPKSRVFGCSTKWSWKRELAIQKSKEWSALPVTLESADAKAVKSLAANQTEKLRLINVWATDCGPCLAEFPDLIDAYQRYQRRGFELVTISTDSAKKEAIALKFLKKQHAATSPEILPSLKKEKRTTNNYRYSRTDLDDLANALDPKWEGPLPHTILVAPGGKVLYRHTGQVDAVELRRAIVKAIYDREQE